MRSPTNRANFDDPRATTAVAAVAQAIALLERQRRLLVAVDGVDGAGKTTFADMLAQTPNLHWVRATCDAFHNPKAVRYRRGRESPRGFFHDSFDYDALERILLAPFRAGTRFRRYAFDYRDDQPLTAPLEDAPPDAILVLDGLFLHRERLRSWWDFSVLLDVAPDVAADRLARRDGEPSRERYFRGQDIYFRESDPAAHATITVPW